MLNELESIQESDETVLGTTLSFEIETRSGESSEIIHRCYTFGYAKEWDKWMFQEFEEKRSPDTDAVTERNWRQSRHIMWNERDTPSVDVPPEVADELQEATGAESIVIQSPSGGITENDYNELYIAE